MSQRELIQSALETLGPERLTRGLVAFDDDGAPGDWHACFLARCYGEPGALDNDAGTCSMRLNAMGTAQACAQAGIALGLSSSEVDAIVTAFDNLYRTTVTSTELRAMVEAEIAKHEPEPEEEDDDFEIEVEVELDEELEPATV